MPAHTKLKIAINGFGRIGRAVLRQVLQGFGDVDVVLVNDIAPAETCAYLLEFDSVYGPLGDTVSVAGGVMSVGKSAFALTHNADLSQCDLTGVDVVLDCTGKSTTKEFSRAGLRAGARKVIISGPSSVAEVTLIEGANADRYAGEDVVSNGSCTTHAVAPLLNFLHTAFGVSAGHMTTIHCYTGSQPTIDAPRGNALERNRAAALSMVPTTTSAMALIDQVLPEIAGRVCGGAVRVPTASVSAVDLVCTFDSTVDFDAMNNLLLDEAAGIIGTTHRPLVSSDLRARRESLIVALPELRQISENQVRIFGWYDNEWGFSARMLELAHRISAKI